MISNFSITADNTVISWEYDQKQVEIAFQYPVAANHITHLSEVIVQSDTRESGTKNLIIYDANGLIKIRPDMPQLKCPVEGIYAVWFVEGKDQLTVILLTDEYKPYDTACTFDLKTHEFFDFHPSR